MGKYTKFKETLPRQIGSAPDPEQGQTNAWNDEVELIKRRYAAGLDPDTGKPAGAVPAIQDVANLYDKRRNEKEDHEAAAKSIGKKVEALTRLLVEKLEEAGLRGITAASGRKFDIDDKPHSTVEDPAAFIGWVDEEGMRDMLRMPWQTMNAEVKRRLEAGLEPPPGVKVFLRSSITRRKAK